MLNKQPANKREIIIFVFVTLAMIYLSYGSYYAPKSKEVKELEKQLSDLQQEIKTLELFNDKVGESRKKQIQKISSRVKQSAQDDPRLQLIKKARAPEFHLFEDFMKTITSNEFRSSLDVQSLTYSDQIKYGGFAETEFTLTAIGPYMSVMTFMKRLEKVPALVTIKDFKLLISKKDTNVVTLSIKASFYQLEDDHV